MQDEQIDGLAINHTLAPLLEERPMHALNANRFKGCVVMEVHQKCL
jgi:hypothetical protein